MKLVLIAAAIGASLTLNVSAQSPAENTCAKAPAEKRADCVKWVETCRFDSGKTMWVNKKDGKPCMETTYVVTAEEVRARRAQFLATHKYVGDKWVPLEKERPVCVDKACTQTRAEVKADLDAYMKTHTWDEGKTMYVPK